MDQGSCFFGVQAGGLGFAGSLFIGVLKTPEQEFKAWEEKKYHVAQMVSN